MRRQWFTICFGILAGFFAVAGVTTLVISQETPQEQFQKEQRKRDTILTLIGESTDIDVADVVDRFEPENDFVMYHFGEQTYLLNRRSGMSWVLDSSALSKTPVWLPIKRIDDPQNAKAWKKLSERESNNQGALPPMPRIEE